MTTQSTSKWVILLAVCAVIIGILSVLLVFSFNKNSSNNSVIAEEEDYGKTLEELINQQEEWDSSNTDEFMEQFKDILNEMEDYLPED